ncbi:hypothetical protein RQM65_07370 [Pricia sp. S334]|uniref:Lipocalin-like domain-containing protein n=1 Tax=Pricia mediterranea TaxID=3076079 RepID=A0ABU3L5U4_9FLAO|nr:hypothetical protein [Pricia sp. S334]MDT7828477.1 hypothetical protein [Pricia sp. S334]
MKNLPLMLLLNLLLISASSCQDTVKKLETTEEADLKGTWVYSQPAEEKIGFSMTVDGEEIDTQPEDRGEDYFYLVFDGKDNLIEYKIVFGFRSKYSVEKDTLYINQRPVYRIAELTSDNLTLKYLEETKTITYSKTKDDLPDIPIMN